MIKLIIEADLSSEELQVLISEVTILHRDVFKKPLVLQQTDVSGSLPPMVNPDENNGWSFDYKLLEKVADAACEIEEGVSMEDVDAILTVLWRQ